MKTLEKLQGCADVASLREALQQACEPLGAVRRLDILTSTHEGRQQAICFLRMATQEQDLAVMRQLGVGRFGGEIVFVVDLATPAETADAGPSSAWADFEVL